MNYQVVKYRLAILTSHPIQYQAPLFRKLAAAPEAELLVIFRKKLQGGYFDKEFDRKIVWDVPLLNGYRSIFLNFPWSVGSVLRKEKPNVLIVYGWNAFSNWQAIWFAVCRKIPFFIYGESPLNQEILKKNILWLFRKPLLRFLFQKAAGCFYIGEENRKFYEHFGVPREKLFFTPYAVENERFVHSVVGSKKLEIRKRLNINKDDVVILFVGKLIPKKRPSDLLKAYELLVTDHELKIIPHLLFVGDGLLRGGLEKYSSGHNLKNVHFIGFKNQTELPLYYATSDIFVLPSGMGETWGLVVNEVMCLGLPIIVSDVVGCGPDLVYHGRNGYIFPVGDTEELAMVLFGLIKDQSLRKKFGEESSKIIKNYSYKEDLRGIQNAVGKYGSSSL